MNEVAYEASNSLNMLVVFLLLDESCEKLGLKVTTVSDFMYNPCKECLHFSGSERILLPKGRISGREDGRMAESQRGRGAKD